MKTSENRDIKLGLVNFRTELRPKPRKYLYAKIMAYAVTNFFLLARYTFS